jgi:hypothetical protein
MYGGESPNSKTSALSDMWILSVPSFHWTRLSVDSPARKSQGCTTVGNYMVTYGGVSSGNDEGDKDPCDQVNYGLRLFDMSKLAWTTSYSGPPDAGKNAYAVPKVLYNVIGGSEQGGATRTAPIAGFETPGMAALFQRSNPTGTTSSPGSPNNTGSGQVRKKLNVGAIAGGVIGGLAVLGIILLGVLWLLKRKRKQRTADTTSAPDITSVPVYEVDSSHAYPGELPGNPGGQETKWGSHEIYTRENAMPQGLYAGYGSTAPSHAHVQRS